MEWASIWALNWSETVMRQNWIKTVYKILKLLLLLLIIIIMLNRSSAGDSSYSAHFSIVWSICGLSVVCLSVCLFIFNVDIICVLLLLLVTSCGLVVRCSVRLRVRSSRMPSGLPILRPVVGRLPPALTSCIQSRRHHHCIPMQTLCLPHPSTCWRLEQPVWSRQRQQCLVVAMLLLPQAHHHWMVGPSVHVGLICIGFLSHIKLIL